MSNDKNDNSSPNFFSSNKSAGRNVKRLNNKPLIASVIILLIVVGGITITFMQRQNKNIVKISQEPTTIVAEAPIPIKPEGNNYIDPAPPPPAISNTPAQTENKPTQLSQIAEETSPIDENIMRIKLRIEERRLAQMEAALSADSGIKNISPSPATQGTATAPNDAMSGYNEMLKNLANGNTENQAPDPNKQDEKIAFLKDKSNEDVYLQQTRQDAIAAQYEIKAGTIIPGVMIGGINSDLPGQIIGQVRESVFDSATGQNVLIPMGSRLVGTYSSRVSLGQSRVLIAWNRVIYPDGSSLTLENMPGADQEGYAGFNDKVNNHYFRIFGNALLLSVIAGASQLSQNTNPGADAESANEIMAAELGRQWGEVGAQMTQRNIDIQPTLEIRPGYNFNIMVTKDIIINPWKGHPLAYNGLN